MNNRRDNMYASYRNAVGMTQEHAAELLGVAPRTLQGWERGESTPPNDKVLRMCDIYTAPTLAIEHLTYCRRFRPCLWLKRCASFWPRSGIWNRSTRATSCCRSLQTAE